MMTVAYTPPEIMRCLEDDPQRMLTPNSSLDMWSLGLTLFEIFCGKSLWTMMGIFDDDGIKSRLLIITDDEIQECLRAYISNSPHRNSLLNVLSDLLKVSIPHARCSASTIRSKHLFTGGATLSNAIAELKEDTSSIRILTNNVLSEVTCINIDSKVE